VSSSEARLATAAALKAGPTRRLSTEKCTPRYGDQGHSFERSRPTENLVYVSAATAALSLLLLSALSLNEWRLRVWNDQTEGHAYRHELSDAVALYAQTRDHSLIFVVLLAALESICIDEPAKMWTLAAAFLVVRVAYVVGIVRNAGSVSFAAEAATQVLRLATIASILLKFSAR
jgi:uncharacterized membrane protein YecN with MAPEG domain